MRLRFVLIRNGGWQALFYSRSGLVGVNLGVGRRDERTYAGYEAMSERVELHYMCRDVGTVGTRGDVT